MSTASAYRPTVSRENEMCGAAPRKNVGEMERFASSVLGGMFVLNGIARGSLSGLVMTGIGAALAYRGYTGHCQMYEALHMSTRECCD